MPQIEVTFDIDANGIVHVSAKDLGTGKEQKVTITASGGLSKDEIERMVKEAELHAQEDKQEKEKVEVHNQADSLVYQAEKTIKDLGEKADSAKVEEVNKAIEQLKESMKGTDLAKIKADTEALQKPLYELSAAAYAKEAPPEGGQPGAEQPAGDNVVDADYTVVDEEKK